MTDEVLLIRVFRVGRRPERKELRACVVDLHNHNVCEIPEGLRGFEAQVRELKVRSSRVASLPEWIGELVHLESLSWSGRAEDGEELEPSLPGSSLVPYCFGNLTSLHTLKLEYLKTDRPTLPSSFFLLTGTHMYHVLLKNLSWSRAHKT